MKPPIMTNQLEIFIDRVKLYQQYNIYKITLEGSNSTQNYIPYGAMILDNTQAQDRIISVHFQGGQSFYVLMQKKADNKKIIQSAIDYELKNILEEIKENPKTKEKNKKIYNILENLNIKELSEIDDIPNHERIIASLLLKSLNNHCIPELQINNLSGHLYCYEVNSKTARNKWIEYFSSRDKQHNQENKICKIHALEIIIDNNLKLQIPMRTFSSVLLKNQITFTKEHPFHSYPQYTLGGQNLSLIRKTKDNNETGFILRQTDKKRTSADFLNVHNLQDFQKTKMGILHKIIKTYNEYYKEISNISFKSIYEYEEISEEEIEATEKYQEKKLLETLKNQKIKIVDLTGSQEGNLLEKRIKKTIQTEFGLKVTTGKAVQNEYFNIVIIHNKEYYESKKETDPYSKKFPDKIIQHVTLEDFGLKDPDNKQNISKNKQCVKKILIEMLIKNDLKNKKITLIDWEKTKIEQKITFIKAAIKNDIPRFYEMEIYKNGEFKIYEKNYNLFEELDSILEYTEIFINSKNNKTSLNQEVECLIKYESDDENIIRQTDWFTIPNIDLLEEELRKDKPRARKKENRIEILPSISGIKTFILNNQRYYFCGIQTKGMKANQNNAINIRHIEGYKGKVKFKELLSLTNTTLIRNGFISVIPFPIKYLNEYIAAID